MIDMEQLRKLLLVALSSDQPGEVMAAMAAVNRVLVRGGHDHHWFAARLIGPQSQEQQRQPPPKSKWLDIIREITENSHVLRGSREADFIESLLLQAARPHWAPSERQEAWLMDIHRRL